MKKSIDKPEMAQISTFLGIDFGQAKIGLAIADEETHIAFAFDILKNDKEFLKNLQEIVACENVKAIIVGVTQHIKDKTSSELKNNFIKNLEKNLDIKIYTQEEMFSTKMAHENIKLRGKKNISELDDQESARIILQSWLDKN